MVLKSYSRYESNDYNTPTQLVIDYLQSSETIHRSWLNLADYELGLLYIDDVIDYLSTELQNELRDKVNEPVNVNWEQVAEYLVNYVIDNS